MITSTSTRVVGFGSAKNVIKTFKFSSRIRPKGPLGQHPLAFSNFDQSTRDSTSQANSLWNKNNTASQSAKFHESGGILQQQRQQSQAALREEEYEPETQPSKPTFSKSWFDLPITACDTLVRQYAQQKPTSVSLHTLLQTAKGELLGRDKVTAQPPYCISGLTEKERVLLQTASFIRRELPIRLAHRILELEKAPYMRDMPSVKIVKETYIDSFLKILQFPEITSLEREQRFSKLVEGLYEKHSHVLLHMARGAFELRNRIRSGEIVLNLRGGQGCTFDTLLELHEFLDRFYTSRIGIRVLASQYLAIRGDSSPDFIGIICCNTSPAKCLQMAVDDASFICSRRYGDAPSVEIHGCLDMTFSYIPSHLHYILLELVKNSMRATIEHHGSEDVDSWPPVRVIISDGKENEDVVIKISDQGGGIPRSHMDKIWSYLFTTADPHIQQGMLALDSNSGATMDHGIDSPIAGLGYGLPISRSYARYFGGDLEILSMEGHGTDAYIYLRRLGNSREPLGI